MIKNEIDFSAYKPCLELKAYGLKKMHTVYVCLGDLMKLQALGGQIWVAKDHRSGNFYAMCCHNGKPIALHRYLTDCPESMEVDHINGITLDNTRFNIRVVTHEQNKKKKKNYKTDKGIPDNIDQVMLWAFAAWRGLQYELQERLAQTMQPKPKKKILRKRGRQA